MKINGISQTKAISLYNDYKKSVNKKDVKQQGDSIQISTLGKSLSTYSTDETYVNSKEKIQGIANEISMGTYNRDSKLVAEKMIIAIKNNI
ncbi:MAG: flagellar biosynthesis anti-sigma factor FlgM [Solirubrobacterales bacterium]